MTVERVSFKTKSIEKEHTPLTLRNSEDDDSRMKANNTAHSLDPMYPSPLQGWVSFDPARNHRA
jgi:hypothetical protein